MLRYVDNPNGSVDDIAGICNEGRNVVGLMPHPERACHPCWDPPTGGSWCSLLEAAGAVTCGGWSAGLSARCPAAFSTSADTPTSRQAA